MATVVKNGVAKMKSVTQKKKAQKKLANEVVGKKDTPIAPAPKPVI